MASVPTRNHSALVYGLTAVIAVFLGFAPTNVAVGVCGLLIALLGIPHGSLDLHLMSTRAQRLRELGIYLVCIALVLVVWLMQPTLMLTLFLINSAWHFGDCDISTNHRLRPLLALTYGAAVLLLLIDLKDPTIGIILQTLLGYPVDASMISYYSMLRILAAVLVFGTPMVHSQVPRGNLLLRGLLILGVAMLAPSLIAFTWYFVVMHSWTSMNALRHYIDSTNPWSWRMLIIAAAPLSLLTFIGIGIGPLVFPHVNILAMLFIALSALTVPHSRLFHRVYAGDS